MHKKCQHDDCGICDIWIDYQVAQHSLQEAEELSRQNWMEIQSLHKRICQLERFILTNGLELPEEPE